jgi:predicted SAM-dependent methyltransferase
MKKNFIKLTIYLGSIVYKYAKYTSKNNPTKVNLGCGLQCLPGWINIDGSLTSLFGSKRFSFINKLLYKLAGSSDYYSFETYNKIIQTCDLKFYNLKNKVPLFDSSSDIIYCSHFLEHLGKKDGKSFLKECHRSLKKGGLLRIAVPDLDLAIKLYQSGETEKMQDLFFYTSGEWDFAAHKYNYNFDFLKRTLQEIGFVDINKMSYKKGICPDIDFLDVYPEHSLYVECKK